MYYIVLYVMCGTCGDQMRRLVTARKYAEVQIIQVSFLPVQRF